MINGLEYIQLIMNNKIKKQVDLQHRKQVMTDIFKQLSVYTLSNNIKFYLDPQLTLDREEAKRIRSKYYFTDISCKRGHHSPRFTDSGQCVKCRNPITKEVS